MHLAIEWETPCSVTLMRQLQLFAQNFPCLYACRSAIKMQLTRLSPGSDSSVSSPWKCNLQLATCDLQQQQQQTAAPTTATTPWHEPQLTQFSASRHLSIVNVVVMWHKVQAISASITLSNSDLEPHNMAGSWVNSKACQKQTSCQ